MRALFIPFRRLGPRGLAPRTLRARATVAVTAALAAALVTASMVLLAVMRTDLWDTAREAARDRAVSTVDVLDLEDRSVTPAPWQSPVARQGPRPAVIAPEAEPPRPPAQASDPAPVPWPSPAPPDGELAEVHSTDGRYAVAAYADFGAARETLRTMALWMVPITVTLALLGAWVTWTAVGRVLAPVEALRGEVAEITATDLHRRLAVPTGRDEIARLAIALNATLDRLERAVSRLRTFTGDVSHELRSPLTVLRMRLELALARPAETDWPKVAADALEDTDELHALVDDLLLLARLDAHQPGHEREVDLARLARTHASVGDTAQAQGARVTVEAPGPVPVRGTPQHLARLITNLVENARRHARTTVRIRVSASAPASASTDPRQVVLEVTDDGGGIAAADRERVFERFTRLDTARSRDDGGAGLGLAIARAIAAAHHGTLTAEEPEGPPGGARLVLRLPDLPDLPGLPGLPGSDLP
ncbi:sensor histidine kinase [Streptomyces sp. NPDC059443]|uniref:sensor histidine kinase n=1 Tax=unclassified Streptomyces TaxID=2593676 RepID=UPI0036C79E4F